MFLLYIMKEIMKEKKLVKFSDTIPVHWYLITGLFLCLKQLFILDILSYRKVLFLRSKFGSAKLV